MNEIGFTRFMDIYIEIDNLKDYELTNCIAYEMAIRNKELLTLLYNLHFSTSQDQINKIVRTLDQEFYFNTNCINYFNSSFHFKYIEIFAPELNLEKVNKQDVKFYNIEDNTLNLNQYSKNYVETASDFNNNFLGFKLKTDPTTMNTELLLYDFSRPTLSTKKEKELLFEINPNFPKNETLNYVKHVLDILSEISNNNKIYSNAKMNEHTIQQLLQIKDNSKLQNKVNTKSQSLRAKRKKEELQKYELPKITKQNIFANQFLIYDYITYKSKKDPETKIMTMYENINAMINLFVQKKFMDLNGGEDDKKFETKEKKEDIFYHLDSSIDDKTIKKYYSNIQDYIENKKYISLITT